MADAAPDLRAVTQVQQQVWSAGDFAKIGNRAQIVGERLCETVDLLPDERVLDVACGSGNAALAASRRFGEAVGVDYVPELLANGRERAAAEGLDVEFVEGDAQELPFEDAAFDVVLSTFGAMFAPDQAKTAAELLRVCRPGGRIGMANWMPDGLVFFPDRDVPDPPPGVVAHVFTTTDGVRIHAWWAEPPDARATLVWSHGNGGNIAGRGGVLRALAARGVSVLA